MVIRDWRLEIRDQRPEADVSKKSKTSRLIIVCSNVIIHGSSASLP